MFRNYVKIALRNLRHRVGQTLINVLGLAVGIACCILIGLYVDHEVRYDDFHEKSERIHRLAFNVETPEKTSRIAPSAAPMGPALVREFSEVQEVVRFGTVPTGMLVEHTNRRFYEEKENVFFADSTMFDVMDFSLRQGDPQHALAAPYSAVLTPEAADKYFGSEDPIGQMIRVNGEWTATVKGVLEEIPSTSHLQFDLLFSFNTLEAQNPNRTENWLSSSSYTYVLLRPGAEAKRLEEQLPGFLDRHVGGKLNQVDMDVRLALQPLSGIYLHSDRLYEAGPTGNPSHLYVFSAIAVFVLLIACVNFMNLATARSTQRAKEVGMRKALGSRRSQLAGQFLGEAILISSMALLTGLAMSWAVLPAFNALADKSLTLSVLYGGPYLLAFIGLAILIGLIAGSYPALVLSRYEPAAVLRGASTAASGSGAIRKGLVTIQFAISIALIAGTAIVYSQLSHMRSQDLGFDKEHTVAVDFRGASKVVQQREAVKREFESLPMVRDASFSSNTPGEEVLINTYTRFDLGDGTVREKATNVYGIDKSFVETYDINLAAGRAFSEERATDSTSGVLINEAAARNLGFSRPKHAIGMDISHAPDGSNEAEVIGVVQDFNYEPLRKSVEPLLLEIRPNAFQEVSMRLKAGDPSEALSALKQKWQRLAPDQPFQYTFLNERFDRAYRAEARFGQVFGIFAGLAILIACLGLFGLTAFAAERRTKEIGVRKALGASIKSIVALLSKDFLKLVVIAFVVAVPVAYWAMSEWLQGFAYRTDIGIGVFLLAGLLAVVVALLTISYHALRAAQTDPVDALQYE